MFGPKKNPPPMEPNGLKVELKLSEWAVIKIVTITLAILLSLVAGSNGLANLLSEVLPSVPEIEANQSP